MNQAKLHDWLEIVGIFAVVASLLFVGLQMRQTQTIAQTEMDWNNMMAEMQSRSAIYEHPDIWARGNAGDKLNSSEAVIYTTLIRDFNTVNFFKFHNAKRLEGADDSVRWIVADTAGFLHKNPGARREWNALRAMFSEHRNPFASGNYQNAFEKEVRAGLALLEKNGNSDQGE